MCGYQEGSRPSEKKTVKGKVNLVTQSVVNGPARLASPGNL